MILVLTTKRSGSTFISNAIAKEYGYTSLGEFFGDATNATIITDKLEFLKKNTNTVVKIFPEHMHTLVERNIFRMSELVVIHGRKNFNAQCRSLYISDTTDTWHANPLKERLITYRENVFSNIYNSLKQNYLQISDWKKSLTNYRITYLEDQPGEPYNQPVVWDVEPPHIDFDVEAVLND